MNIKHCMKNPSPVNSLFHYIRHIWNIYYQKHPFAAMRVAARSDFFLKNGVFVIWLLFWEEQKGIKKRKKMKFCWKYHVSYQCQWVRDQIWTVHVRPGRGGDASAPPKCHGFSWKHQVVRVNPYFRIVEPTHTPCPLSSVGVACILYIYSASALLLPVLYTRLVLLYNYILDYGIDPNTQHHPSMSSASVRPPW